MDVLGARDDLIRLLAHAVATPSLGGPVNATAPEPVTNRTVARALAARCADPLLLRVPAGPLRALAGDLAEELLLGGQRVLARQGAGERIDISLSDAAPGAQRHARRTERACG